MRAARTPRARARLRSSTETPTAKGAHAAMVGRTSSNKHALRVSAGAVLVLVLAPALLLLLLLLLFPCPSMSLSRQALKHLGAGYCSLCGNPPTRTNQHKPRLWGRPRSGHRRQLHYTGTPTVRHVGWQPFRQRGLCPPSSHGWPKLLHPVDGIWGSLYSAVEPLLKARRPDPQSAGGID